MISNELDSLDGGQQFESHLAYYLRVFEVYDVNDYGHDHGRLGNLRRDLQRASDTSENDEKGEFMEKNEESGREKGKTASGIDENLAGLLCYLCGFVTGIIFMLIEKDNRFIRFHALQSIFVSVGIIILNWFLNLIPLLGFIISFFIMLGAFVLWIVLMTKAYQGQRYKLPIIGDMVEKQLK